MSLRPPFADAHYRPEIDGLRALAVLAVVFFHAGWGMPGGYLGVDVFFVISGYVIASHLLRDHRAGTLSLPRFYEKRARRIIPALYVVMGACIPLAWASMLPDNLQPFGQNLAATALFAGNVHAWYTSGYWRQAGDFVPLVHTWSLGVEEQINILFPFLLLPALRKGWWVKAASAVALAGIAWAQWRQAGDAMAAYMFPFARASEFLAGALLGVRDVDTAAPPQAGPFDGPLAFAGLSSLAACMFLFSQDTPHPGVLTLLPVASVALLIRFATPATGVGRVLGSSVPVAVGLASYGIYLWHQPALAFLRLRSLEPPGVAEVAAALGIAGLLAAASWRWIELPARARLSSRGIWSLTLAGALFFVAAGVLLHFRSGPLSRHGDLAGVADAGRHMNAAYNSRALKYRYADFAEGARHRVLVIGRSFASDFINSAVEAGYLGAGSVSYVNDLPACLPGGRLPERVSALASRAEVIVFAPPPADPKCWPAFEAALSNAGRARIVVLGPKYFGWNMNALQLLPEAERRSHRSAIPERLLRENDELAATVGPARFVDQLRLLADPDMRVAPLTAEGLLISHDGIHLTAAGARHAGRILFEHPLLRDLR